MEDDPRTLAGRNRTVEVRLNVIFHELEEALESMSEDYLPLLKFCREVEGLRNTSLRLAEEALGPEQYKIKKKGFEKRVLDAILNTVMKLTTGEKP